MAVEAQPIYCSVEDVARLLHRPSFDQSTSPDAATVEGFIRAAQRRIEDVTKRAWREVKVIDVDAKDFEYHNLEPSMGLIHASWHPFYKYYVQLNHPDVITPLDTTKGDSLLIYSTSGWTELVGAAPNDGTDRLNGNFWVDATDGLVFFQKNLPLHRFQREFRCRYRYGRNTDPVDAWAKNMAAKLASLDVMLADVKHIAAAGGIAGPQGLQVRDRVEVLRRQFEDELREHQWERAGGPPFMFVR